MLPATLPGPPAYYGDLHDSVVDASHTLTFGDKGGANVVNGMVYDGSVSHRLQVGSVQEWVLRGGEGVGIAQHHPYHQHVTHFQIVATSDPDGLLGHVGDWRDTVSLYGDINYTVRFVAPFPSLMMVHCHILKHAELGMMTLAEIVDSTAPAPRAQSALVDTSRQGAGGRAAVFFQTCLRLILASCVIVGSVWLVAMANLACRANTADHDRRYQAMPPMADGSASTEGCQVNGGVPGARGKAEE